MVGGGEVAARKVVRLLECGAQVWVVSPELVPELACLTQEKRIEHIAGPYLEEHLKQAAMVIGATDDEAVNAAISHDAKARGIPVNIVDDPQKCDFILPSLVERGDLTIACGTGGNSPALARQIRKELEAAYGVEYGKLLEIMGKLRSKMEKNKGQGKSWFEQLMAEGLLESIRKNDAEAVKKIIRHITGQELDFE